MEYRRFIGKQRLLTAWRQITTGRNLQYKRFFRLPYQGYQIASEENVEHLHHRLRGGWRPHPPERAYLPKPDGLQRPISLLHVEDQIVLQSVAFAFAQKLRARRANVEGEVVFSNLLEAADSPIFFLQNWRSSYGGFQDKCIEHFRDGLRWVAHFDIAAFYDTISHDILLSRVAPRGGGSSTWNRVRSWLRVWSTDEVGGLLGHGLPQGPIASDFLSECMLLPIDERMLREGVAYVRYVDDIRIFARTRHDVERAVIRLEMLCRSNGLIPQGAKFRIEQAGSPEEALGRLPSIAPPDDVQGGGIPELGATEAERMLRESLTGRPLVVTDKSKFRYVLYRAPKSARILRWCLGLLPRHPEHIDAFAHYFSNYRRSAPLVRAVEQHLNDGVPYEYVRGELWHVLARIADVATLRRQRPTALSEVGRSDISLPLEWGVFAFLLRCEKEGLGAVAGRVRGVRPLVQCLLAPVLPERAYRPAGVVRHLLRSPDLHPGLGVAHEVAQRGLSHRTFGLKVSQLAPCLQNTFRRLGVITRRHGVQVDQIAFLLEDITGVPRRMIWKTVLDSEYQHALYILAEAASLKESHRSPWLQLQDSFNDVLFRAFLLFLNARGMPGGRAVVGRDGRLIKYGVLLDPTARVSREYPRIGRAFRDLHQRRNQLPGSHPYDERGGAQTRYLSRREQVTLLSRLRGAYSDIAQAVQGAP